MSSPHCRVSLFPPNPPLSVLSSLDSLSFLPCGEGTRARSQERGAGARAVRGFLSLRGGGREEEERRLVRPLQHGVRSPSPSVSVCVCVAATPLPAI